MENSYNKEAYAISDITENRQCLLDLVEITLKSKFSFAKISLIGLNSYGTGFFDLDDFEVLMPFRCNRGEPLNYWEIVCLATKIMNPSDTLHYFRTVMQIDKKFVSQEFVKGNSEWDMMKEGYSRGICYGLESQGTIAVYVLDYSVFTGEGYCAKLTKKGTLKRHEDFALYPFLSARKNLQHHDLLDVNLPNCYFNDGVIKNLPYTVFDSVSCIEFTGNGIAYGSIENQAFDSINSVLTNCPNAKVAVNVVVSIEMTAIFLVGQGGGRKIYGLIKSKLENDQIKDKYKNFLLNDFNGLLQTLYASQMSGFIFKRCGVVDDLGNHTGVVYFIGTKF